MNRSHHRSSIKPKLLSSGATRHLFPFLASPFSPGTGEIVPRGGSLLLFYCTDCSAAAIRYSDGVCPVRRLNTRVK